MQGLNKCQVYKIKSILKTCVVLPIIPPLSAFGSSVSLCNKQESQPVKHHIHGMHGWPPQLPFLLLVAIESPVYSYTVQSSQSVNNYFIECS